jgi:hypothetical protein
VYEQHVVELGLTAAVTESSEQREAPLMQFACPGGLTVHPDGVAEQA